MSARRPPNPRNLAPTLNSNPMTRNLTPKPGSEQTFETVVFGGVEMSGGGKCPNTVDLHSSATALRFQLFGVRPPP